MRCPICTGNEVVDVLIRDQVPVHQNRGRSTAREARAEPVGTLRLVRCPRCDHAWNAAFDETLVDYSDGYDNRQEGSPAFAAYVDTLVERMVGVVPREARIVEVGCGRGHFLRRLCEATSSRGVGYDPAYRGPVADGPLRFVRALYGPETATGPADLVVCRHVIEHVADPLALVRAVRATLQGHPDARVAFECPDAGWIARHGVVWDVFYEHAQYFTPASLSHLFRRAGFVDVQVESVFGGQYQWLTARPGRAVDRPSGAPHGAALDAFGTRCARAVVAWRERVHTLAADGPVVLWGAGAKGATTAHLIDADASLLAGLVDIHPAKQGRFTPVTGHPIVSPEAMSALGIRHAIVMNPAYLPEIRSLVERLGLGVTLHAPDMLDARTDGWTDRPQGGGNGRDGRYRQRFEVMPS